MELKPRHPPGHANRKLRGLVSEIERLRAEGYTIGAIHLALEDAGVKVGWATVQREVARLAELPSPASSLSRQSATRPVGQPADKATPDASKPAQQVNAGKDASSNAAVEVDSYFDQHNTNPLFKRGKLT